ncbi:MAG: DNA topoisomerase [Acidobacteriota bacterium]
MTCSAPPAASRNSTGFLKVYVEGKDQKDEDDEEEKNKLPAVTQGEVLKFKEILPEQHFSEPPPRFTEATLVKELEASGVGRPSTYASILSTIQEREYVRKDGGKFSPTELGMVVTDLLLESFNDLFGRDLHGSHGRAARRHRRWPGRLAHRDERVL